MRNRIRQMEKKQASLDRAVFRAVETEHPHPETAAVNNQSAQQFAQTCPLRLPTPGSCPFGGICHSCPARVQAKLTVSQPNDEYEQEADRVADQVMRMPEPQVQQACQSCEDETLQTKPLADQITPLIQRQEDKPEEEEEEPVQTKLAEGTQVQRQAEPDEEEEPIQTKQSEEQMPQIGSDLAAQIHSLRGGGQPLPQSARDFFEPHFGADFGQVRVHTSSQAAETAQALNACAFTVGNEIMFGTGLYEEGTSDGKRLLAHELVHVVQQTNGTVPGFQKHMPLHLIQCDRDKDFWKPAKPSKETALLIRFAKYIRKTLQNNAQPRRTYYLLGFLTSALKGLQEKQRLHAFTELYQREHGITIQEDIQSLINAGKLNNDMDEIRARFPILWPKAQWSPKMLPSEWKEKSLQKLKEPGLWPKSVKGPEGDLILGGVSRIVMEIQFYGPWVIEHFDYLCAQGTITPEEAKHLSEPHGDLILTWKIRTKVWNRWLQLNKVSVQPTMLVPNATPSERAATVKAAKAALPGLMEFRKLFDKTPSALSTYYKELLDERIGQLERKIKVYGE